MQRVADDVADEAAHRHEPLRPRVDEDADRGPAALGLVGHQPRLVVIAFNLVKRDTLEPEV